MSLNIFSVGERIPLTPCKGFCTWHSKLFSAFIKKVCVVIQEAVFCHFYNVHTIRMFFMLHRQIIKGIHGWNEGRNNSRSNCNCIQLLLLTTQCLTKILANSCWPLPPPAKICTHWSWCEEIFICPLAAKCWLGITENLHLWRWCKQIFVGPAAGKCWLSIVKNLHL